VVDATPLYWAFEEKARGAPLEEQARLFRRMVVDARPELYTAEVLGFEESKPFDEQLAARYTRVAPMIAPLLPTMRRLSTDLVRDLPAHEASFRRTFPDLAYDGEIYFLASLGGFDGGTRSVKGRTALLFGIDMIAYVYGPDARLGPLFDHELFHIYHEQFPDAEAGERIYRKLWEEGLATYVARTLNPDADERTIFGLPEDMPARSRAMLPRLAGMLREKIDSTEKDDYKMFFWGGQAGGEIPQRSGYYVGHAVVERIGRGRALPELARLRGAALRDAVRGALDALAQGTATGER
jgi:hypothetical protein